MANSHNFMTYADRAKEAHPSPLVEVSYYFTRFIPGTRENWFFAWGLPGLEFGWRYTIEYLALPSQGPLFKKDWYEQDESYSLTLLGANSAAKGKLPPEILPWTQHTLGTELHGPWGVISDFQGAIALEELHGSDWLAEKILFTELLALRVEQSKGRPQK